MKNPIRAALRRGETVTGVILFTGSPVITELAAAAGIDFVIIDIEHSALDLDRCAHIIRAADAAGARKAQDQAARPVRHAARAVAPAPHAAGLGAVAHLADQLDADLDVVAAFGVPGAVGLADGIDQAHRARGAEVDGDHLADRPLRGGAGLGGIGEGADGGAGAVALHDMAEDAGVGLLRVAAFLRREFAC